jgi:hypothetical protein
MRRLLVLGAVLAGLAGCGGGEEAAQTPAPTPTATPRETPTASVPRAPDPPPDSATPGPEDQEGGAGDEEPRRVRVVLTLGPGEGVRPATVSVPPFFSVELRVRNRTEDAASVTVRQATGDTTVSVAGGEAATLRLEGFRPGRYEIDAGSAGTATLVAGDEAGP